MTTHDEAAPRVGPRTPEEWDAIWREADVAEDEWIERQERHESFLDDREADYALEQRAEMRAAAARGEFEP